MIVGGLRIYYNLTSSWFIPFIGGLTFIRTCLAGYCLGGYYLGVYYLGGCCLDAFYLGVYCLGFFYLGGY